MGIDSSTAEQIDEKEHPRDSLLRIFNILENSYGDLQNYIDAIDELHLEGVINDRGYRLLLESLAQFSTAFADLASTIDAVKRSMSSN
jgi:hypothetical protein